MTQFWAEEFEVNAFNYLGKGVAGRQIFVLDILEKGKSRFTEQ